MPLPDRGRECIDCSTVTDGEILTQREGRGCVLVAAARSSQTHMKRVKQLGRMERIKCFILLPSVLQFSLQIMRLKSVAKEKGDF